MKRPRWSAAVAAAAAGVLGLTACGAGSGAGGDGPVELVMAVETSPGDPLADMLNLFADSVEEKLGDQVEIERHLGGAIGDETAILEGLRAGEIDAVVLGSDISGLEPSFDIMEMPFLFEDRERVSEFLDGDFGTELSDRLEESAGLTVLSYGENGFRHITNNTRPISTPADLNGIKLRVPEVPARVEMFRAFGAVPTPMSIDEVYISLDQGALDGQENPLVVIDAFSFYEVQKYLSLSGHVYSPASLTMNQKKFESLSPEVQDALREAAQEAAEGSRDLGEKADEELIASFEEAGVEVNEIDKAAFQGDVKQIWDSVAEGFEDDFAQRVLAEYGDTGDE
ncbi:MAG: TRAP transporter substrate-binding protein [Propionibacteriaceae bacterium]